MGRNIFLDFSNILKCGQNSAQCSYVSSTWLNNPKSYSPRPLQLSCGTSFPLSLSHRNHIVSSTDASVSIPKRHRVPIFLLFCFYESIFGLQCCVSFKFLVSLSPCLSPLVTISLLSVCESVSVWYISSLVSYFFFKQSLRLR